MDVKKMNQQLIVLQNEEDYKKVVEFCIENKVGFQAGLDVDDANSLAEHLSWESSNEWQDSGC